MKILGKARDKINYQLAAGTFVGLLLLAAISPGLVMQLSPTIQTTSVSAAAYTNSNEYTIYPTPTETDYSRYESISVYGYSCAKKSSANDFQGSLRKSENSKDINPISTGSRELHY